jgi:hypothetical protein
MAQVRDALQAWARSLPETATSPQAKETPEQTLVKKLVSHARRLAKEQRELREATRKLLTQLAKGQTASSEQTRLKENVEKLAQELIELSQNAGPESKHASQEAAHAAQDAQKAMAKSEAAKQEGRTADARQGDAEAAERLELAGTKAQDAAEAMSAAAKGGKYETGDAAVGRSLQESEMKLEAARQALEAQPAKASAAMQQAAQAMKQTAKQMQGRMASAPIPQGNAPAQASSSGVSNPAVAILADHLKAHSGKAWGELPGELRTRIVQDLRARYGDEYGPIIQRYFQHIADTPAGKHKK